MRLRARCELVLDALEETPLITMLRPHPSQPVLEDSFELSAAIPISQYVDAFGNHCQRFTVPRGELRVAAQAQVDASAEVAVNRLAPRTFAAKLPDNALQYTLPSRYCPADKFCDRAKNLAPATLSGYRQVETIRNFVHDKLDYRYGVSDGSTDAEQTLQRGAGVCRDFAHVCIALCRAIDIPARMVVGYLHHLDPMDLHAWFEAYVGDRWYTFDATEDTLRGGRIVLAYGRDAADVAFLTDFGALKLRSMHVAVDEVAIVEEPTAPALDAVG